MIVPHRAGYIDQAFEDAACGAHQGCAAQGFPAASEICIEINRNLARRMFNFNNPLRSTGKPGDVFRDAAGYRACGREAHRARYRESLVAGVRHEVTHTQHATVSGFGEQGDFRHDGFCYITHAHQLAEAKIPFIFDPGQGLPMFDGPELKAMMDRATWVAVNDYEGRMLCDRTGFTLESLSRLSHLQGVIVTLGGQGCDVWINGQKHHVPGVAASQVVDPTGCGDAFRGAVLYGIEQGWSLVRCVELANRVGALKIACQGGQNHVIDRQALGL